VASGALTVAFSVSIVAAQRSQRRRQVA